MKKHLRLAALACLAAATLTASAQSTRKHELPKLPYALGALAPKMSLETLEYHYGKHYKGYIDNLNTLYREHRMPTCRWRRSLSKLPTALSSTTPDNP